VSELRHDVLTGRLVLLAPGRESRPSTFAVDPSDASRAPRGERGPRDCPFCPGHEHETPPEVARTGPGAADTPGWRVRVVPNLYPIVGGESPGPGADGAHEVVVLSPDHDARFGDLDDDQAVDVLTMLRARARAHSEAGRPHVQLIVNEGRAAGASIEHPHAQVLALDFVPPGVSVAVDRFAELGSDPLLADYADAVERDQAVVAGDEVAAWCPVGSASPYEIRLAVVDTGPRLEDATDGAVLGAALVLRDVLAAVGRVLDGDGRRVAYNVVVHDGPVGVDRYHWWIGIIPRVAVVAGFEIATAVLVNTVDPLVAAERVRSSLEP
jgi:UDPglucose--hexose-1-phosphate uridylyltransferase